MSSSMSIPGLNKIGTPIVPKEEKTGHKEEMGLMKGFGGGFGVNFNKLDEKVYIEFSKSAPPWRVVSKGVNFEAQCRTKECDAYQKMVWVQKGMGEFNIFNIIFDRSTKCPRCDKPTEDPKNVAFYDCKYAIKGRMLSPERKKVNAEDTAPSGKLTTFKPGEAHWIDLIITTSKV